MKTQSKFEAHVFICTNKRAPGQRECCADKSAEELRDKVKKLCGAWKGKVRVNASGCLDRCEEGITAVIYPQNQWFVGLNSNSEQELVEAVSKIMEKK